VYEKIWNEVGRLVGIINLKFMYDKLQPDVCAYMLHMYKYCCLSCFIVVFRPFFSFHTHTHKSYISRCVSLHNAKAVINLPLYFRIEAYNFDLHTFTSFFLIYTHLHVQKLEKKKKYKKEGWDGVWGGGWKILSNILLLA